MAPKPITENTLFYGDNLFILREYLPSESVDLIYLDPPFNSSRNYNVLFKDEHGSESQAQIAAFEDTWHWNLEAERTYTELLTEAPDHVARMIEPLRGFIGDNQLMAYLVMMATRLVELHCVLKPTGSLYLHCDPTASHYLKIILDTIFGPQNFRSEIVWKRKSGRGEANQKSKEFGQQHDIILFYSKANDNLFHTLSSLENAGEYIVERFKYVDEDGRRYRKSPLTSPSYRPNLIYEYKGYQPPEKGWAVSRETMEQMEREGRLVFPKDKTKRIERKAYLDEYKGQPIQSIWTDIPFINPMAQERLGYPTQKPIALLERIIQASSNPGDVILDPFCGCGTAIAAAQKLGRKWIGIDVTHLSIALMKYRLEAMFPGINYDVVREPQDVAGAADLAKNDRYQFQWWALSLVKARPSGGQEGSKEGKKGSDKGIDGVIAFIDDSSGKAKRVLVQVKSGHVKSGDIRDLRGTIEREKAAIGVFITLEEPSKDMVTEAVKAGFYHSIGWGKDYPRLQILTIDELLHGKQIEMPPQFGTFKQPLRVRETAAIQEELELYTG